MRVLKNHAITRIVMFHYTGWFENKLELESVSAAQFTNLLPNNAQLAAESCGERLANAVLRGAIGFRLQVRRVQLLDDPQVAAGDDLIVKLLIYLYRNGET